MKRNEWGSVLVWIVAFLRRPATGKPFVLSGKNFGGAPQIYLKHCAPCHGEEGFGDGKAAYLLHPRPRDFSYGKFILVSTDNREPNDEEGVVYKGEDTRLRRFYYTPPPRTSVPLLNSQNNGALFALCEAATAFSPGAR